MTRDDIIRMAREAGRYASHQTGDSCNWQAIRDERFAGLVAQAEREACATICDIKWMAESYCGLTARACAAAIRARGDE